MIVEGLLWLSVKPAHGMVDIMDQKLGTFVFPHKNSKRHSAIYHKLREVALANGYIVCCQSNPYSVPPKTLLENVIDGLLEGYEKRKPRVGRPTNTMCSSRTKQGWKRKTNYMCRQCNLPMCFVPCHEIYHTYSDFHSAAARIVYNMDRMCLSKGYPCLIS